jgi:hypothetical protein
MTFKFPKQQMLRQFSDRDCGVPVFAALAGVSEESLLAELPQAQLGLVTVGQWEAWLKTKGLEIERLQGCPIDVVKCAHLLSEHQPRDERDFHWIYRDEDGDVHDPNFSFSAMPADDERMRELKSYPYTALTLLRK